MAIVTTATIRTWAVIPLAEKVAAFNRRADKLNLEPMTLKIGERYSRPTGRKNLFGDPIMESVNDIELVGNPPRVDGWELVAKITPATEDENFVHLVPGIEEIDPKYRTIKMICNHCDTTRRRNDVFVIRNGAEEKVVGRNCLADFLRTTDAEGLIKWADFSLDVASSGDLEEWCGGGRGEMIEDMGYFLRLVSVIIRKIGWVPRSKSDELQCEATVDTAAWIMYGDDRNRKITRFVEKHNLHITDHDKELVEKALTWIRGDGVDTSREYMHNLRLLCSRDYLVRSEFGLAGSLIATYRRQMEYEVKRRERDANRAKANADLEWIGELKERLRGLTLLCLGLSTHESQFGVKTFIRFRDTKGNSVIWSASGDKTEEFEEGETYTVDATVRKHDEHKTFGKQTFVNRVTVK